MSNDPVLIAYGVKRRSTTKRVHWQRIGEAYPHDSGAGMTIVLDAMPLDGRIILLEPTADDDRRLMAEAARLRKQHKPAAKRRS